jgi:hypothetical protein
MFDVVWILIGFVVGMTITAVFVPPTMKKKVIPDVQNPDLVFRNPKLENGCFKARAYQVACTSSIDILN